MQSQGLIGAKREERGEGASFALPRNALSQLLLDTRNHAETLSQGVVDNESLAHELRRLRQRAEQQVGNLRNSASGADYERLKAYRGELAKVLMLEIQGFARAGRSDLAFSNEGSTLNWVKRHYADQPQLLAFAEQVEREHRQGRLHAVINTAAAQWSKSGLGETILWAVGAVGVTAGAVALGALALPVAGVVAVGLVAGGVALGLKNVIAGRNKIVAAYSTGYGQVGEGLESSANYLATVSDLLPMVGLTSKLGSKSFRLLLQGGKSPVLKSFIDDAVQHGALQLVKDGERIGYAVAADGLAKLKPRSKVTQQLIKELNQEALSSNTALRLGEQDLAVLGRRAAAVELGNEGRLAQRLGYANLSLAGFSIGKSVADISQSEGNDKGKVIQQTLTEGAKNLALGMLWGKVSSTGRALTLPKLESAAQSAHGIVGESRFAIPLSRQIPAAKRIDQPIEVERPKILADYLGVGSKDWYRHGVRLPNNYVDPFFVELVRRTSPTELHNDSLYFGGGADLIQITLGIPKRFKEQMGEVNLLVPKDTPPVKAALYSDHETFPVPEFEGRPAHIARVLVNGESSIDMRSYVQNAEHGRVLIHGRPSLNVPLKAAAVAEVRRDGAVTLYFRNGTDVENFYNRTLSLPDIERQNVGDWFRAVADHHMDNSIARTFVYNAVVYARAFPQGWRYNDQSLSFLQEAANRLSPAQRRFVRSEVKEIVSHVGASVGNLDQVFRTLHLHHEHNPSLPFRVSFSTAKLNGLGAPLEVVSHLKRNGYESYIAGGAVRDLLLGKNPKDVDLATAATPAEVSRVFPGSSFVGENFGVSIVKPKGAEPLEVATFRVDGDYKDGRRPDSVQLVRDAMEDVKRRDFTINAMLMDGDGHVIDYFNGREDLRTGVIRAVGDPQRRISEDRLRMLRAVRFAARYDYRIEPELKQAIRERVSEILQLPGERVKDEFQKMFSSAPISRSMKILDDVGLLSHLLPEVKEMQGQRGMQDPRHHPEGTAFQHTMLVLDNLERFNAPFELKLATLLHDIGKPRTQEVRPDGRITFYGHEDVGAEMAAAICDRIKLSRRERDSVVELVADHMRMHQVASLREGKLKALLSSPLYSWKKMLQHADALGTTSPDRAEKSRWDFLTAKEVEYSKLPQELAPGARPLVTGKELISWGLKPGPKFRALLDRLYELQLSGTIRSTDEARDYLRSEDFE